MSRIADLHVARKLKMPLCKRMGKISSNTEKFIRKMILVDNYSNIEEIKKDIQGVLQTVVSDIKTYSEETDYNISYRNTQEILNISSIFIINVSPIAVPVINIENESFDLGKNIITFINHRYAYDILHNAKSNTMLLTGMFDWDVNKHAD